MKRTATIAVTALTAVGGGAAIAGAATSKPATPQARFADHLADRLGVSDAKLQSATEQAGKDTIADLRRAGKLDEQQAARLEKMLGKRGGTSWTRLGAAAGKSAGVRKVAVATLAKSVGLDVKDVRAALKAGKAPSALIAERGKDQAAVSAAIRDAVAQHLVKRQVAGDKAAKRAEKAAARFTGDQPLKRKAG